MAEVSIDVRGQRELIRKLNRLEKKQAKAILRKSLRSGAKLITQQAKANAPRGETGQLRKAIKTRAMKKSRTRIGFVTQIGSQNFVGKTFYGAFLEWGTKRGIAPMRFMELAAEKVGQQAIDKALGEIQRQLTELVAIG